VVDATNSPSAALVARGKAAAVAALLRPHQWFKNGVVLAPLVFAHRLLDAHAVALALLAVVACCALSSAAYALNDLHDADADRAHPAKRLRPLASGALAPADALLVLALSTGVGMGVCWAIGPEVAVLGAAYLALQHAYTTVLKRIAILDVIAVATGFILRAYIGGFAIDVDVSPWLVLVTFLLALFLALVRRRQELAVLGPAAESHRVALADYTPALLDQMIGPVVAATLVAYMIYSVSSEVTGRLGTSCFHLTVPFVVFGMFRYLYLVHRRHVGEDPARLLLADGPLLASVLSWASAVLLLLYGPSVGWPPGS
jgi:4-hydroxybenzoate polyprenyltransferase